MAERSQKKDNGIKGKATGWPRPERKIGQSMGLNPMRMAALVILALTGVLGGYLIGKYLKPESKQVTHEQQAAPEPQRDENLNPPSVNSDKHDHYEESLPRNIVIQQNGQLKRIALPEPDMELDFGPIGSDQAPKETELAENQASTEKQPTDLRQTAAEANDTLPVQNKTEDQEIASMPKSKLVRAMPTDLKSLLDTSAESLPPWLRNAVPVELNPDKAKIVIVMDDVGLNRSRARRTVALPAPLTLSFMAYAEALENQISSARAVGHEIMLHVPMEPKSESIDPGPNVLLSGIPKEELVKSINWNLDQTDRVVGINNHMGSRFTSDMEGMKTVTEVLSDRGLLFLDSVTSGSSVAHIAAENAGIPFAVRNVFLDHEDDLASIRRQLRLTESIAKRTGVAIAIGHPRDKTLEALTDWLPTLSEKGLQLVPISAVVKMKSDRT